MRRKFSLIVKRQKKRASQTDKDIDRHLMRRLVRLGLVKRFLAGWVVLVSLLIVAVAWQALALNSYYKETGPVPGGTFREGIVGQFRNANPIYADGTVDSSVSRLVFSGLLKYDKNQKLVGDLAERWEIDELEKKYTFHLRKDVKWHDEHPFTADDVAFTVRTIQDIRADSHLRPGWREVKVKPINDHTVEFTLPSIYGPFEHSLTTGILPRHILEDVEPEQLRSSNFNNIELIGTGPFRMDTIETLPGSDGDSLQRIGLLANEDYYLGEPKIDQIVIRTYPDNEEMLRGFEEGEIRSMVGLTETPEQYAESDEIDEFNLPLSAQTFVFFKASQELLRARDVRQALILAANPQQAIDTLGYPLLPINSPLLNYHIGYSPKLVQRTSNVEKAKRLLDRKGWKVRTDDGIRSKNGVKLKLNLYAANNEEFSKIAQALQQQWRAVGIDVETILQDSDEIQLTTSLHNYDMLLGSVSVGPDPDVYAYWHASTAAENSPNRLNFSEYRSRSVDQALEQGRSRTIPAVRAAKYRTFLKHWINDAPALALYQPRFLYIVQGPFAGFESSQVVSTSGRFNNVHEWQIREGSVPKLK